MSENKENIIQTLSFQFAIDIISCYKNLEEQIKFIAKMFIAHKESRETSYRLRLLFTT